MPLGMCLLAGLHSAGLSKRILELNDALEAEAYTVAPASISPQSGGTYTANYVAKDVEDGGGGAPGGVVWRHGLAHGAVAEGASPAGSGFAAEIGDTDFKLSVSCASHPRLPPRAAAHPSLSSPSPPP